MQPLVAVAPDDPSLPREPAWLPARIFPPAGGQARRVVVLDLSPVGAQLKLVVPTAAPLTAERINLAFDWEGISAEFQCRLVRATVSHLNVRFAGLTRMQATFLAAVLESGVGPEQ